MSKSKGNVIDPLELIEKYSADALRFTLLSMASPGRDVKLSEDRVKGYRNFLNKIWNANNFLIQNSCDFTDISKPKNIEENINKWIITEFLLVKENVKKNISDYRFDEAAKNVYQFVWHSFCDWYLELSKTIYYSDNQPSKHETRDVSAYLFREILILLHPFTPFITEEVWLKNKLDKNNKDYLMFANWSADIGKTDKSHIEVNKIINIISSIRSFKNEIGIPPGSQIEISLEKTNNELKNFFDKNNTILTKLGRIKNISLKDLNKSSASLILDGELFKIYFEENVDLNRVKDTLKKKLDKLNQEMGRINQRLVNKNFVEKAPAELIDQEKTNFNNLEKDVKKIQLTLENL
jgi:valyl-tRNA synthetase